MCIEVIHVQGLSSGSGYMTPVFPDANMMFPTKRLYKRKDTACVVADIFRIHFPVIAGTHRQRVSCFPQQLVWFFIHAYDRTFRVVRHFIDIFHAEYEFCVFCWQDIPIIVAVRTKRFYPPSDRHSASCKEQCLNLNTTPFLQEAECTSEMSFWHGATGNLAGQTA